MGTGLYQVCTYSGLRVIHVAIAGILISGSLQPSGLGRRRRLAVSEDSAMTASKGGGGNVAA